MKTTIDLPSEIVRELKIMALRNGQKLQVTTAQCLAFAEVAPKPVPRTRKRPGNRSLTGARVVVGENGLPVIRCVSTAPATRMSAEALLALEQQSQLREDLLRAGISL